jgi:polyisoprenyl-teichoic acid--peptidoglycan teichoic acid transferase
MRLGRFWRVNRARPRRALRPKRVWVLRTVALATAVCLVAGGAFAAYLFRSTQNATDHLKHAPLMPGDSTGTGPEHDDPSTTGAAFNMLVIGSDGGSPTAGRSDTLLLLHVNADRKAAYVVSFPRDLYVPIPGHGQNKINSGYAFGGPQLTVQTMQNLLGTKINHAALVDFSGIVKVTNQLGGVTIMNKHAFSSHGFEYPKGKITLSGDRAMWFVRERYAMPKGDLDRAANNRKLILAILAKGMSAPTIRNPVKFSQFVSGVAGSVTLDNGFSNAELRRLALSLRMTTHDIHQIPAPLAGFDEIRGVGAVDRVDRQKLGRLSTALRDDDLGGYLRANPNN